jgi:hypothetical protein
MGIGVGGRRSRPGQESANVNGDRRCSWARRADIRGEVQDAMEARGHRQGEASHAAYCGLRELARRPADYSPAAWPCVLAMLAHGAMLHSRLAMVQ